jgi:predicted aspartyl protease
LRNSAAGGSAAAAATKIPASAITKINRRGIARIVMTQIKGGNAMACAVVF